MAHARDIMALINAALTAHMNDEIPLPGTERRVALIEHAETVAQVTLDDGARFVVAVRAQG